MDLNPGSVFGPYRIDGPLGRGGMASVYRAWEEGLARHVALKVLPAELLHDAGFAERFAREARVAARLEHPHIVPIYAYGIEGGRPWMALRLLPGGSLGRLLKGGRLETPRALAILRNVAEALDHAHRLGVVHRDVKPPNILLDERGRAYLADFGIARMIEASTHVTATGIIQGTPTYMAPEQASGASVGPPCDVYALGIVAYECLTGRVPFVGPTPVSVLLKQVSEPPPLPPPAEMPPLAADALRRCLAKLPEERWPGAEAFVDALAQGMSAPAVPDPAEPAAVERSEPSPAPPKRRPAVFALAAVAAAAVLGLALWRSVGEHPGAAPPVSPTPAPEASAQVAPSPSATAEPAPVKPPLQQAPPLPRPSATAVAPPAPQEPPASVAAAPAARESVAPPEAAASSSPPPPVAKPPAHGGSIRVFVRATAEQGIFGKVKTEDLEDSAEDLRKAIADGGAFTVVGEPSAADATLDVLERGRKKTLGLPGSRQVRVRVSAGGRSIELLGQDSALGFNTWKGAAKNVAKQAGEWLRSALAR